MTRWSGCGSVGRAVAFNSRDPRFESQRRQSFIYQLNRKVKDIKKWSGKACLECNKDIDVKATMYEGDFWWIVVIVSI